MTLTTLMKLRKEKVCHEQVNLVAALDSAWQTTAEALVWPTFAVTALRELGLKGFVSH